MPEIRSYEVAKRRRKDGLLRYARSSQSQSGEDGIIAAIFGALDEEPPSGSQRERFVVDVGAWDGVHLSNSHALLVSDDAKEATWRGLLIEADPKRFAELKALHDPLGNATVRAFASCSAKSHQSLPAIMKRHHVDKGFDLLSVDIDGPDYWLLKATLEAGYRPKVALVEFNPTIPHDVVFIQDRDDKVRQGTSLAAFDELAKAFRYRLAETTTYNAFFVRNDVFDVLLRKGLCHDDATLADLHDMTMGTNIYQLYDGTLKLAGCKKLLWHRLPLDEQKLQHLPPNDRVYPFAPPAEHHHQNGGADDDTSEEQHSEEHHSDEGVSHSLLLEEPSETTNGVRVDRNDDDDANGHANGHAEAPKNGHDASAATKAAKKRARRKKHKALHLEEKPTARDKADKKSHSKWTNHLILAGCGLLVTAFLLRRTRRL